MLFLNQKKEAEKSSLKIVLDVRVNLGIACIIEVLFEIVAENKAVNIFLD